MRGLSSITSASFQSFFNPICKASLEASNTHRVKSQLKCCYATAKCFEPTANILFIRERQRSRSFAFEPYAIGIFNFCQYLCEPHGHIFFKTYSIWPIIKTASAQHNLTFIFTDDYLSLQLWCESRYYKCGVF